MRELPGLGVNDTPAHLSVVLDKHTGTQAVEPAEKYPEEVLADKPWRIARFALARGKYIF